MPYPAGLTLVTVTGRVPTATSGQASFIRPYTLVGAADNAMVPPETKYASLNASGEFTIALPATSDPGWIPVGSPYLVEILSSAGIIRGTVLLSHLTTAVELADLLQVDGSVTVGTSYIALSARGVALGVAALDADGDVNNAAGNKITGGGGGTAPTFARAIVTAGDITLPTDASWTPVAGLALALPAVAGDDVEIAVHCLIDFIGSAADFFDIVILVGGAIVRYASTGTSSPTGGNEGDPAFYPDTDVRFRGITSGMGLTLVSGDVSGGNVTFGLAHRGTGGTCKVFASANYPFRWRARNDH